MTESVQVETDVESPNEYVITPESELKFIINGKEHQFKHITPKISNLIKINIVDPDDGMTEGIWACLSDEDMVDYKHNVKNDKVRPALLRNTSIYGITWGTYIPVHLNGRDRPVFDYFKEISGNLCFNQVNTDETA